MNSKDLIFYASTVENPIVTGYSLMCAEYNQSFPNVKKLQNSITEWMADFDQAKTETTPTEDGWSKVGKKKAMRVTEEEQNQVKQKNAKRKKKNELVRNNFIVIL